MKKDIQPAYYPKANVHCACGNSFQVGAAVESIETEVCAKCHTFYTKQERIMDTLGRVQKFKDRLSKKKPAKVKKVTKKGPSAVTNALKKETVKAKKEDKKKTEVK